MRPVMIMAGGTGGHVFPALAVAKELRQRGVPIVWVGTANGIEADVVPAAGLRLIHMHIQGLRGKGKLQLLKAPFLLARAMAEAFVIVLRERPQALLGMGGFVAGPCALAASLLRMPLVIHEQNATVGLTNRLLAPLATTFFSGFDLTQSNAKAVHCGNPVRSEMLSLPTPDERYAGRTEARRILIIGGSLGARGLNQLLPISLAAIEQAQTLEIWHQTGKQQIDEVSQVYKDKGLKARVTPFIEDMAAAYAWADLLICRSGAMTLAEIASVGLPAVLVPYPHAVDDHQTSNANSFVRIGAAYLMQERDTTAEQMSALLSKLISKPEQLLAMANAAYSLRRADAVTMLADSCQQGGGSPASAGGLR
jgi:UDP-N-acetylglucosamine--N-acetylmuramyl-(pentapeptide) pyrophosphoryl-undecaprenol N-acetylglucosamine transferase